MGKGLSTLIAPYCMRVGKNGDNEQVKLKIRKIYAL